MTSASVEMDTRAAVRMLDKLADRLDDRPALLRALGEELSDYEERVFATRGGGTWAPLHPATVRAKGHGRVLVDSGGLLRELTSRAGQQMEGESVSVDTDDPRAEYLARGARGTPKRNPTPSPSPAIVRGWAETLLGEIVRGR